MATRRKQGLRADLPSLAVAGTVFGNIASAAFLALGVTAGSALGATPFIFIAAGFVLLVTVLTYIEGIAAYPQAGGAAGFARLAFNDLVGFIAGWALLLDYMIVVAASAYFAVHYVASIPGLHVLATSPWDTTSAVLLTIAVAAVAAQDVRFSGRIAIIIGLATLVFLVALATAGLFLSGQPSHIIGTIDLGTNPTWTDLRFALPIAMIGFSGIEVIANLSGEMKNPGRELPRPMIVAAVIAVFMYVLMSIVGLSAFPVHTDVHGEVLTQLGTTWVDRPVIGIIEQLPLHGSIETLLKIVTGLLAASVLFLTANASMGGLSRMVYAMSVNRQAPAFLSRIDRDEGTPAIAIVLITIGCTLLLVATASIRGSAVVLAQLYAFGAMLGIAIAVISVIRLRFSQPDTPRPYLAPFNVKFKSRLVSLSSVLAAVLAVTLWWFVLETHDAARALGLIWLVAGFIGYGTYRLTHGLSMVGRASIRVVPELAITAQRYRTALIAVRPERGRLWGQGDAEVAAVATKLLDDVENGELAVVLVHELPLTLPLNAPLGAVEQMTSDRISLLRKTADKLGVRLSSTVARSRAAGRALCQEAERRNVDVVVLAMRAKKRPGGQTFGRTVSYVLRHAPCDVVVMSFPEASLKKPSGAAKHGESRKQQTTSSAVE